MQKTSRSDIKETLRELDLFAAPVQLKFNNRTTFKTNFGGVISIIYLIVSLFVFAVFFKKLIVGYDVNAVSTTYDLYQTDDSMQNPVDASQVSLEFGFQVKPSIISASSNSFIALTPQYGRFELLNI